MNHVFVDFENVSKLDFSAVGAKPAMFTILTGPQQTRMDMDLVQEILKRKEIVQVIPVTGEGKNALDFVLAYQVGLAVARNAKAFYHIVSKDKGFEALIRQLTKEGVKVRQHADFTTLSFAGPAAKTVEPIPEEPRARVLERLRKNAKNRPGTAKRLLSYVLNALGAGAKEIEAQALMEALKTEGFLKLSGENGAITYTKRIDSLSA